MHEPRKNLMYSCPGTQPHAWEVFTTMFKIIAKQLFYAIEHR